MVSHRGCEERGVAEDIEDILAGRHEECLSLTNLYAVDVRMLGEQFCIYLDSGEKVHEIFTSPMLRGRSIKLLQLLAVLLFYSGNAVWRGIR